MLDWGLKGITIFGTDGNSLANIAAAVVIILIASLIFSKVTR